MRHIMMCHITSYYLYLNAICHRNISPRPYRTIFLSTSHCLIIRIDIATILSRRVSWSRHVCVWWHFQLADVRVHRGGRRGQTLHGTFVYSLICLSACLMSLFIEVPIYLRIYLSICIFVFLFIYLFIYLFMYLFCLLPFMWLFV